MLMKFSSDPRRLSVDLDLGFHRTKRNRITHLATHLSTAIPAVSTSKVNRNQIASEAKGKRNRETATKSASDERLASRN